MLRDRITEVLAEQGPKTVDELEQILGVPRALLRTALTGEFYEQREIDHPVHGRVTSWALSTSSRVRADGLSGKLAVPLLHHHRNLT